MRKITSAVARIKACEEKHLIVGDLKPERDWGYAPEYMEMMWKIIDGDTPCDYVIGTGEAHTVGGVWRRSHTQGSTGAST